MISLYIYKISLQPKKILYTIIVCNSHVIKPYNIDCNDFRKISIIKYYESQFIN